MLSAEGSAFCGRGALSLALEGDPRVAEDVSPAPPISPEAFLDRYARDGERLADGTGGGYSLALADRDSGHLILAQSPAARIHLYYTIRPDGVFFATSLRSVLRDSGVPREWNEEARHQYMLNGFVPTSDTLIAGVHKLLPGELVDIDVASGDMRRRRWREPVASYALAGAVRAYYPALCSAVIRSAGDGRPVNLALSGGFDTNLIFHILQEARFGPFHVFSVGGVRGKDETPVAEAIAAACDDATFHKAMVTPETLERFPDLAWRLEGALLEPGVFLQHELLRAAAAQGVTRMLCGEGADQIMRVAFHGRDRRLPPVLNAEKYPREVGLMLFLKKAGLLTNAFGISAAFPFLAPEVLAAAQKASRMSLEKKLLHVCLAWGRMPAWKAVRLRNRGGCTHETALFASDADFDELKRALRATRHAPLLREEYRRGRLQIHEMGLYLKALALALFDEFIRSGRYDDAFEDAGCDLSLSEVLPRL